ncbi:MAG: tRNA pseudouridine(55) synthase TruB [Isosphaeraceae bacterium]
MATLDPCPVQGILNLNKPTGRTSRDVVNLISRPLRRIKVGHAGTLDPLASGVLVVCVGAATRLIEYVQRMPKTYRALVRLGARSNTLDADGQIVETANPNVSTEQEVRDALATQIGTINQVPPQFSALKVAGRRAYDLARAGKEVDLAARPVTVYHIELLEFSWPRLTLEIDCGSGTYIRSIARDLGEQLGCGGLIEVLERTRIGPFTLADAVDPTTLTSDSIPGLLRPMSEAVANLPAVPLTDEQVALVARGQALDVGRVALGEPIPPGELALFGPDGALVAVAESDPETGKLLPRRVLIS